MTSSLHTLYRPQTLKEVVGQEHVTKPLAKMIEDKRAHTFLFCGPAGTGKTTLARICATLWCGGELKPSNLYEVDAATNTGVEAMRAVAARADYRSIGKSPTKVFIIDEAHRLSGSAWDSILKATEEPPDHVFWIFCTTNPSKVPKTVQTRCQRFSLKEVPEEKILKLLAKVADSEELNTADDVLEAIAENAGGSPRQALVYLESCMYCEDRNEALRIMRSAGESKEVIDLCRWLVTGQRQTWAEAVKLVSGLGDVEAEGVRIQVTNYMAKVLLGTKDEKRASYLINILDCFGRPYNTSDKMAPLLLSLGMVLGLDR